MSSYHPGRERTDNETFFEQNSSDSEEHDFISISQRFNDKTIRQA